MRRLTASLLAAGAVLMALSVCAEGAMTMTMSEMMCCAEHHDACDMAGMAESCCGTDRHTDTGMLKPARTDDTQVLALRHSVLARVVTPHGRLGLLSAPRPEPHIPPPDVRSGLDLLHAVLLI